MKRIYNAHYCWLAAYVATITIGWSVSIVVPNDLEIHSGNGATLVPFSVGTGTARFQQVFDSSQFAPNFPPWGGIGPGGAWISMISFRVDEAGQNFNAVLPNIQIDLSTTSKAPDALSPIFAANVGPDDTIVRGSGALSIRSGGPSGLWDVVIPLNTPFFYQPSAGNLLMEVRNFGGGFTTFFDGAYTTGDSISSVYAYTGDGTGNVESPVGTSITFGLVTLFEVTPVPEPGTVSLLLLGVCVFAFGRWRSKSHERN